MNFVYRLKQSSRPTGLLKRKIKENRDLVGLLYILPWFLAFLLLEAYPLLAAVYYSFTDYTLLSEPQFVGFKNFSYMFTQDPDFLPSVLTTLKWVIIAVPLKITTALVVAIVLNSKLKFINIFRAAYYLPSIFAGSVAISILWRFLFMSSGLFNQVLSLLHLPTEDWLGDPKLALYTVSLVNVWQFGTSMVLFLAGLKQISQSLYEAAKIDGANAFRRFWSVSFPMLTPILMFNLIIQTFNAFQDFTTPFVITRGGPIKSTYLFTMLIYDNGFTFFKMGYASALSFLLFFFIILFTAVIFVTGKYWVYYEDGGKL